MHRLAHAGHAVSMDPQRLTELHASTAQIAAAGRIATALVVGFQLCADARQPLNELQRIELVKTALLVFEDFKRDVESQIRISTALGSFADEVGSGSNGAGHKRDAA
jgi:hypothetical protein